MNLGVSLGVYFPEPDRALDSSATVLCQSLDPLRTIDDIVFY